MKRTRSERLEHELAIALDALRDIAWSFGTASAGGMRQRAAKALSKLYPRKCRRCSGLKLMEPEIQICDDCNPGPARERRAWDRENGCQP